MKTQLLLPMLVTCLACSATSGSGDTPGTGGAGNGVGANSAGGASSGGSGPISTAGAGGAAPSGECTNVDLLFVIDNSASMADQQQSLISSFPGFVEGMKSRLANAQSYHIGVVTTDDYYENQSGCSAIGSLVTKTGGVSSSNTDCTPFSTGARFLDSSEPDLLAKFACAAKVGVSGNDDERVARALLNAVDPTNNAPGTCNAGFARKDSLLIVTLITDEDDVPDLCDGNQCETYGSGGTPQEWYDQLVAYRGGLAQNIVVLSLLGRQLDNSCGAQVAAKLVGFTKRFGANGYLGDVCSSSYDSFFQEALPVIETACQNFEPPK
ncbi:MAG: hypothetical protein R3B13_06545 [Polyangiaceae bacterium]